MSLPTSIYPPANQKKPPLLCQRQNNVAKLVETHVILESLLPVFSLVDPS